ncbi:GNAT family N-acetyltransferase [Reyranella sp.]|uniref:GNAT family N-acetyltransferase n=1 Tax=Reyranella sp. TaxID=1929291 RepID=UPI0025D0C97B|nr:GNAT family N-acetyltransferase [Reyranella sp.]
MASDVTVRAARPGEAEALTALAVRSKAHWGYDAEFMRLSQASLTVSDADIASGLVLVAERQGLLFGLAKVEPDGELDMMFVDPLAMNRGVGRLLFEAAVALARRMGARRMAILADPNAAPFYERMGARFVSQAPSDAIPGRTLPLYEYDLTR